MLNQVYNMFFGNAASDEGNERFHRFKDGDGSASLTKRNLDSVQGGHYSSKNSDGSPSGSAADSHSRKKRGRPPKLHRPPSGAPTRNKQLNIDVGSYSNESDSSGGYEHHAYKRKRGDRDNASIPHTPSSMLSERSISMRRSHRGRHIDTSKEMIVLLPDTDPRSVLEIRNDTEWDLFQQALNEDNSGDWSDGDEHAAHHGQHSTKTRKVSFLQPHAKKEVYIPGVEEATETAMYIKAIGIDINTPRTDAGSFKKFSSKPKFNFEASNCSSEMRELVGQLHESRIRGGYANQDVFDEQRYDDSFLSYDASSDDESFIEDLLDEISSTSSKKATNKGSEPSSKADSDHKTSLRRFVNNRILELMFARLEKELELVKCFTRVQLDTVRSYHYIHSVVQASQHIVSWSKHEDSSSIGQIITLEEKLQSNLTEQALKAKQENKEDYLIYDEIAKKGEDGQLEPRFGTHCTFDDLAYFRVEDLQRFIPEDHAMYIMSTILDNYLKPAHKPSEFVSKKASNSSSSSSSKTIPEKEQSVSYDITPALKQRICREMYFHWIYKRSEYKQSFLRAYHRFMMHLWHPPDKVTVPMHTDYDPSSLITSYQQLQKIRKDLDRARLIVDRVRRREKLKKDMVRCSSEQLDMDLFGLSSKSIIPTSASTSSLASLSQNQVLLSARKRGRPKLSQASPHPSSKLTLIQTDKAGEVTVNAAQGRDRFGKFLRKGPGGAAAPDSANTKPLYTPSRTESSNSASLLYSIDPNRLVPDDDIIFSILSEDDSDIDSGRSDASFHSSSSNPASQLLAMVTPKGSANNDSSTLEDPPSTETNIDKADVKQINKSLSEAHDDDKPSSTSSKKSSANKTRASSKAVSAEHKTPIKSKYMLTDAELQKTQQRGMGEMPPSGSRQRVSPGEQLADSLKVLKTPTTAPKSSSKTSKVGSSAATTPPMSNRRSSRTAAPECSLIACIPTHKR